MKKRNSNAQNVVGVFLSFALFLVLFFCFVLLEGRSILLDLFILFLSQDARFRIAQD